MIRARVPLTTSLSPPSTLQRLRALPIEVNVDIAAPFKSLKTADGRERDPEATDIATALSRFGGALAGPPLVNRSTLGRKGRVALQRMWTDGSILFEQQRANEFQLNVRGDAVHEQDLGTIPAAPIYELDGQFVRAPGHGLGFKDLKAIDVHEIRLALVGNPAVSPISTTVSPSNPWSIR